MTHRRSQSSWLPRAQVGFVLVACVLPACKLSDDLVVEPVSISVGGGGASGGITAASGAAGATGGTGVDNCDARKTAIPAVVSSGTLGRRCSAWAARRSFSNALCSCGSLTAPDAFMTDGSDSSNPDLPAGGAAVGINGTYRGGTYVRIEGSFTLFSTTLVASAGGIDIRGDLRLRGPATAAGPIFIGRDAWLLASSSTLSPASVGRDLHLGPDGALTAHDVSVFGKSSTEAFEIAPTCACGAQQILDIQSIVDDVFAANDNQQIGLKLDSLANVASAKQLSLACGRYALRGISGTAATSLRVSGRVVLAVQGDVQLPPGFTLQLEPNAQVDWFITGNLDVGVSAIIGTAERRAAVRIYTLGSNDITLPGTDSIAVNLYAPHAKVVVNDPGKVYGGLFAGSVESAGSLIVYYDRAILRADETCNDVAPPSCTSCDQCGASSTCVAGKCGACTTDADCCSPLVCEHGSCQALD